MGSRQIDSKPGLCARLILLIVSLVFCSMVYLCLSVAFRFTSISSIRNGGFSTEDLGKECCRGIDHMELWGNAVKWGAQFRVKSSEECCWACKEMCNGVGGQCLCDSWVFCGDRETCGEKYGECWLKKQKDTLDPDRRDSGDHVMWTSGLIFGKGEGIVNLKTDYGILHIELFPDCAPYSVTYILELLASRHCAGCHLYRAESRGSLWDSGGNHIGGALFGPPFALIQGTLEAHGTVFENIPREDCLIIRRGSVAWIGSGPDFFISLANHIEWRKPYTVFGSVLSQDMEVAEKIAQLPTRQDSWSNITVSVLEKPVSLSFERIKRNTVNLRRL